MWKFLKRRLPRLQNVLVVLSLFWGLVSVLCIGYWEGKEKERQREKELQMKKIEDPSRPGCRYDIRRVKKGGNRRLEKYLQKGFSIHLNPHRGCDLIDCENWILKKKVCPSDTERVSSCGR